VEAARVTLDGPDGKLRAEGLDPGGWGNAPGDRYAPHEHGYDKVLVCVAGSIRFGLPASGRTIDLAVGDRLHLPAGTRHDALVGPAGVTCLEAHLPAGSVAEIRRLAAGSW
jgi:mannose-6-phosphate isomerase-like protein (cupin superfamily)